MKTSRLGSIGVVLAVTVLAAGAHGTCTLTKEWQTNISGQSLFGGLNYEDLDGDGVVDILLHREAEEDRVYFLSGKDGSVQWVYPPLDQEPLPGDPMCVPAIDDLDGDGQLEVILVGRQPFVHCLVGRGDLKWKIDPAYGTDNSATIFDIDGDGMKEVIWATVAPEGASGLVICANHDGSIRWTFPMDGGTTSGPAAWDVDQDDEVEIIVPCKDASVIYCITSKGTERWSFRTAVPPDQTNPVIGDIDNDGEYEILVLCSKTMHGPGPEILLYCLSFYGTKKWEFALDPTTGMVTQAVTIGDIDGDGYIESFVSDLAFPGGIPVPHLYCLGHDGSLKWVNITYVPTPLIGDFTGDGNMNVVGCRVFTPLQVYDANGGLECSWDELAALGMWGPVDVHQIMGDFDGDGKTEWAMETDPDNQVYCFTADGAYDPEKMIWPRGMRTAGNVPVIPIFEGLVTPLAAIAVISILKWIGRRP